MKKFILPMLASLVAATSLVAAPTHFYSAILSSPSFTSEAAMEYVSSITKIEETARFRCPGCYEFTVSFRDMAGEDQQYIFTSHMTDKGKVMINRK